MRLGLDWLATRSASTSTDDGNIGIIKSNRSGKLNFMSARSNSYNEPSDKRQSFLLWPRAVDICEHKNDHAMTNCDTNSLAQYLGTITRMKEKYVSIGGHRVNATLKFARKFNESPSSPMPLLLALVGLVLLFQVQLNWPVALASELVAPNESSVAQIPSNLPVFETSDISNLQSTTTTKSSSRNETPSSKEASESLVQYIFEGQVIERLSSEKVLIGLNLGSSGDLDFAASQLIAADQPKSEPNEHKIGKREPKLQQPIVFTNQFVIQVEGGESEARKVAQKHGFVFLKHILGDYYHLEHARLSRRSISDQHQVERSNTTFSKLEQEAKVLTLERQLLRRRFKRDFLDLEAELTSSSQDKDNLEERSGFELATNRLQRRQRSFALLNKPANQQPSLNLNLNPAAQVALSTQQQQSARITANLARQNYVWQAANQQPNNSAAQFQVQRARQQANLNSIGQSGGSGRSHWPSGDQSDAILVAGASNMSYLRHKQPNNNNNNNNNHDFLLTSETSANVSQSADSNATQILSNNNRNSAANLNANNANLSPNYVTKNSSQQAPPFNDPSWPLMWYLDGGAKNGFDLNVMAAWKMGYTGKGIVITILDDGLEKDHPDLQANYDPLASFDINGDDADPMPRYDSSDSNRHGTRCAGEVAAVPDNNICSIGIAYNSKVGGVRMLDGEVTDAVEARSLALNNQHIHIYSASWGPDDNGKTVDGPGELATKAFIEGVTNGRQGLGSIFVFASGNGGREKDNCNCDGYTNSIWTLSISSASENGAVPWYIESCSSTLATTYSSGNFEERQIATTDLHHSCTSSHTGTSASAPLAAGICALVLESNPRLSWRDMQHIVVRTAKPANLDARDWKTNALGRNVSHAFGYGLMDAAAMILLARQWTTVPEQYNCQITLPLMDKFIPPKGSIELKLNAKCPTIRYLEHVQSKVSLAATRRGDLQIYLVSPQGTRSTLLAARPNDQNEQGFKHWPFMTVHNWGESPNGIWTLEVHNEGKPHNRAFLKEWTLILYGTQEDPNWHLDPRYASLATPGAANNHIIPPPLSTTNNNNNNNNNNNLTHNNRQQQFNQSHLIQHQQQPASSLPPPPLTSNKQHQQQRPTPTNQQTMPINWPSESVRPNQQIAYQQHVPPPATSAHSTNTNKDQKSSLFQQTTLMPKPIPIVVPTIKTSTTTQATITQANGSPANPLKQDFDVVLPASNSLTQQATVTTAPITIPSTMIPNNEQNFINSTPVASTSRPNQQETDNGWTSSLDVNNVNLFKAPVSVTHNAQAKEQVQSRKNGQDNQQATGELIDTNQIDLSKPAQMGKDYRSTNINDSSNNLNRTSPLNEEPASDSNTSDDLTMTTPYEWLADANKRPQQQTSGNNVHNQTHLRQQHLNVKTFSSGAGATLAILHPSTLDHLLIICPSILMIIFALN